MRVFTCTGTFDFLCFNLLSSSELFTDHPSFQGTLTLTCTFIDRSKEEWTLSSSCVDLLEKVISDVNRSAKEAESEAEVRTQMRSPSKSNSASESVSSLQGQGPSPSPSSTSSSLGSSGNGNTNTGDSSVVTVKTPKPKKRRSILAALVA